MSIRIYNNKTKRWEVQTSLHASSIAVRDVDGNFSESSISVEDCLKETKEELKTIKKDIKYIYENGTIGGGGGGGGSFPKLELNTPSSIIVKTENSFNVSYFFSSPNMGDGTANYVLTKKGSLDAPILDVRKTIKQGRNSYKFDPIDSGEYELSITAVDSQGIGSNVIIINITCGALEIKTNDPLSRDVELGKKIVINYEIVSIFKENVNVEIIDINGEHHFENKPAGIYSYEIDSINSLGVKTVIIKAECEEVQSNELKFNFIVTDSSNMFITSNFNGGEFRTDETVTIDYRISLLGARNFLTDVYLNGKLHESNIASKNGHNFYSFNNLNIGEYTVTFKSKTLESVNPVKAELTVPSFNIVDSVLRSYNFTKDGLVLSLNSKGKSNNQEESKRSVWEDTELGVPTRTKLYNFAFNNLNGWIPNSEEDQTVEGLTFAGSSYAEIDLKPLYGTISNGITIEIRHKSIDTGNNTPGVYNFVLDCFQNEKENGKGILIDLKEAFARTSYADSVNSEYYNEEWTTHTIVVNKPKNELIIYCNGCISSYSKMDINSDMNIDKKIILGARRNNEGDIVDNSNCKIQIVRIYNKALNDLEVFKNYVSDLPLEKQDEIISIHEGQSQIPTLKLKFDESALGNADSVTPVDIEYSDPSDPSKNIILYNSIIKKQGTTSLTYPVSNYTINLYDGGIPYDFAPKDNWIPENIFTLKADYMDSSHANNTGIAAYTQEVFKRLSIKNAAQKEDERVKNTIDGFIVTLYINGINRGLYNFNTDRYGAKNYGLSSTKYKTTAVSYEASANTGNATGFHTTDWDQIKGAFKVRYFKGETDQNKYMTYDPSTQTMVMTQGVHKEFERLIQWINSAGKDSNKLFYSEFKEHIDLNHTLIYLLTVEIFGLMDNLEKNMVFTYFGEQYNSSTGAIDEIWYPQLYDMDSSVGLSNNGELKYQPCVNFTQEEGMPPDHQYNGTTSLFWTNVKKHFFKELKDMYAKLRKEGILNVSNLMLYYRGQTIDKVSQYLYSLDSRLKYIEPSGSGTGKDTYYHFCKGRRIEFTEKWISQRITFLDSIYEYGNESNPDGDYWKYIQARYLKKNEEATNFIVQVKTKSPIFLTTVDDSMNPHGKKTFVNNDKLYNITVPINNATDGAMFGITFGPKIMDLKFSDDIRLTSLYLEHGKSIVELNIPDNPDLRTIVLDNCESLQKFNVSGCKILGSQIGSERIKFDNCPNIREIDISNTKLSGFTVNENGGILEKLNCDNSNIETFIIKKQPYITTLSFKGCNNLKKFELENCIGITSVNLPTSIINTFRVLDCPNITSITISNTAHLTSDIDVNDSEQRPFFLIDNCQKLNKIIMSGLNNKKMTWLDLINIEKITYLDISNCGYLSEIRFSEGCNTLETFKCNSSNIQNFKFGRSGNTVTYLDLSKFPKLNNLNFDNCRNLKEIKNSNIGKISAISGNYVFRNCNNLISISGYLRFTGSMTETFYGCTKLTTLPANLDLNGVTSASKTFSGCKALVLNEVRRILNSLVNLTSSYQTFSNCIGIVTSNESKLPSDLFSRNTKLTTLDQFFTGCSNIRGEFPVDLFKPLTKLNYIRYPFNGCALEMPILNQDLIFQTNINLVTLENPFASISFIKMPDKRLFDKCIKLKTISNLFNGKTTMLKSSDASNGIISADYFINNPELSNITGFLKNCTSLNGIIPNGLFRNNYNLTDVREAFYNCTGITGTIPENLFPVRNNSGKLVYSQSLFNRCNGLTGIIPESLYKNHNGLVDMSYVFYNCTSLGTNVPDGTVCVPKNIFRKKSSLNNLEGIFSNCSSLPISFQQNIQEDKEFLKDNINLTNISYMFDNCQKLTGVLPDDLFNIKNSDGEYISNNIINAKGVFRNCRQLGGRIPQNLFKSFQKIQYLDEFFKYCFNLEGGLPYSLFHNCFKLVSVSGFLEMTWDGTSRKIGTNRSNDDEKYIDEETGFSYAFNKELFLYCSKLENVNRFLYSAGSQFSGKLHEETFIGNPELKFLNGTFTNTGIQATINRIFFSRNSKITDLCAFLWSAGNSTITEDSIRPEFHNYIHKDTNGKIVNKNFGAAFAEINLSGTAPKLWEFYPSATSIYSGVNCFKGSTVTNINDIPSNWK